MKKRILHPMRWLALLLVLLLPLTMTSCMSVMLDLYGDLLTDGRAPTEESVTEITEAGGEDTSEPLPTIRNDVVINVSGGSDVSYAAYAGLRSAVSVYASFTSNNPWASGGTAAGSGVIYQLDAEQGSAFVITNYHVVYSNTSNTANGISNEIYLFLYGMENTQYAIPATYVGGSMNYDIAVLRVEGSEVLKSAARSGSVAAAALANSDLTRVGETAIAIGNPESSGISVTTGIVSVDSEYITMTASNGVSQVSFRVVRIDTAVNSGNSGGGLFNKEGKLIGIVNAKVTASDVENIGYAIPSNVARAIADNIIDYCYNKSCETVMRGLLGITVETSALSTEYHTDTGVLERTEEVRVYEVSAGGLGEKILKVGDVIRSIKLGDRVVEVMRQYHLIDAMLDVRVGDTVEVTILRDGAETTVSTVITESCLMAY